MNKKIFMIGNAHIDPVWQWCVPEGLAVVKSTFRSALDRMIEYPNYVFTSACASYYKWIKLSEPEMFEEIRQRIKEGRWQYTGGMWVQPDCNIPCGESFARHLLYSQRFFKENFGDIAHSGYNVDSFGHNGMLPQLFKKAGMDNYVYHRPSRDTEKRNLPESPVHYWESPDGSSVLAYRIPDGYGGEIPDERVEKLKKYDHSQMLFYGVGNHGGGPTREHLNSAEKLVEKGDALYSGVDGYFDYIRENENANIPTVDEDLQHHASGCYSANSKKKKLNRETENELIYAEKIDVLSSVLTKAQPKSAEIEKAWERVMFNQFHDILAGCSIKPAYDDAYAGFGYAKETAMEIGSFAAERISWRVNTTKFFDAEPSGIRGRLWIRKGEGAPMVVFNPHSFPVKGTASFGEHWVSGVVDENNNDVEFQMVRAPYTDGRSVNRCLFEAEIPAYGYSTYFIFKDEQNYVPQKRENQFSIGERFIENSVVRLEFDGDGRIISYFNKKKNKEFCDRPMGAVVCEDRDSDTWGHLVFDFNKDVGSFGNAEFEIAETGTLRATLKVKTHYNNSELTQYYTLYKDSDKVEVRCKTQFGEDYKVLKLTFPITVNKPTAAYSMPFGFIKKPTNGEEEPAQGWTALEDGTDGFALINNGRYSFCAIGNEMRMIAARACAYLDHYGQKTRDTNMEMLDCDELEFTYAFMTYESGNYSELVREAEILNNPLRLYQETHHKGTLPPSYCGMSVKADNVIVQTVKIAEDDSGYVLRAIETGGKHCTATLDLKFIGRKVVLNFRPQEFKTVYIPIDGGEIKEILLTELG